MFNKKESENFRKKRFRSTRTVNNDIFETDMVHINIYAKCPYIHRGEAVE